MAVPRCWVLPIKTELVARKGAPATLYLEILRLHNHFDGDDDGIGDNDDGGNDDDDGNGGDDNGNVDNDHGNGRARCSVEVKRKMKIILQVVQLDLGSLQWQLVIQKCFNEAIIYYITYKWYIISHVFYYIYIISYS